MRSRWVFVSLLVLAVGMAWAAASTTSASNAPAVSAPAPADPYLNASPISTSAPEERKPCTYFNYTCAGKDHGDACGPQGSICLCRVDESGYACVGR